MSKALDLFELAREMLLALDFVNPSYVIMHENEDVTEIALFMDRNLDPTLIKELASTPEGLYILIGITTATYGLIEELEKETEPDIEDSPSARKETDETLH